MYNSIIFFKKQCYQKSSNFAAAAIADAFENPLHIDEVTVDSFGRKSQKFVGSIATANVKFDSDKVITVPETGKSTKKTIVLYPAGCIICVLPHTATALMDAGLPDTIISQYMRHTTTNMTKKYQHIREQSRKTAAEIMWQVINSKTS